MDCIVIQCVFCQKSQRYIPLNLCVACSHYRALVHDGELAVVCNIEGNVVDGIYHPTTPTGDDQ